MHRTQRNRLLGHAKDDAALFVLREGARAAIVRQLDAVCAVVAHAGKDDGRHVLAGALGGRTKEHADRWFATVHRRAVGRTAKYGWAALRSCTMAMPELSPGRAVITDSMACVPLVELLSTTGLFADKARSRASGERTATVYVSPIQFEEAQGVEFGVH